MRIRNVAAASVLVLVVANPATSAPGDLDDEFGDGGIATIDLGDVVNGGFRDVVVAPDGKVVAVGYANAADPDVLVARFLATGAPDTSFSGDGWLTSNLGAVGSQFGTAVAVYENGSILVGAQGVGPTSGTEDFFLARFGITGTLDPEFNGGVVITDAGASLPFDSTDKLQDVVLQPEGTILVTGVTWTDDQDFVVVRYGETGALDGSFSGDGVRFVEFEGGDDWAYAIAVQSNDKIVLAGTAVIDGTQQIGLARLRPTGSLDRAFGRSGRAWTSFTGEAHGYAMALQDDGRIVVGGDRAGGLDQDYVAARFRPGGGLDRTFSGDGMARIDIDPEGDIAFGVLVQRNGRVVLAGRAGEGTAADAALVRLMPDGRLDEAFGQNAVVRTDVDFYFDQLLAVVRMNGRILGAGSIGIAATGSDLPALLRYLRT